MSDGERTTWVGQPLQRLEDDALLRGAGRLLDDLYPIGNAGHAAVLRSQFAHARIIRLDPSSALDLPLTAPRVWELLRDRP